MKSFSPHVNTIHIFGACEAVAAGSGGFQAAIERICVLMKISPYPESSCANSLLVYRERDSNGESLTKEEGDCASRFSLWRHLALRWWLCSALPKSGAAAFLHGQS